MLSGYNVHADIAVKDLEAARKFYGDTLGLKEVNRDEHGCTYYASGNGTVKIYESQFAGTNEATYMSWDVDDVDAAVEALKGRGVTFENYDLPGATHGGDVHVMGRVRGAWFKDPDGNILCVGNEG